MHYAIRHVTRFDYAHPVRFARCNLRLKPIHWSGQTLEDYRLTIEPGGETHPARAQAGLANVTRLVLDRPAKSLVITSSARMTVDRPIPVPSADHPTLAANAAAARVSRAMAPASPAA